MERVLINEFEAPVAGRANSTLHAALRIVPLSALTRSDRENWNELGRHTGTASIFAEPWFMRASLSNCDEAGRAMLAIVEGDGGEWLGALPVTRESRHGRNPMPNWSAWRHPNQFVGTPLVRQRRATEFWHGLIAGLGSAAPWNLALCLHDLPLDDPVNEALLQLGAASEWRIEIDRRFERPRLLCAHGEADPREALKPSHRRRIRSLERKLEREVGPLELEVTREPERVARRVEDFLELEHSGWKGRSGSALASMQSTEDFFRKVAREAASRDQFEIASLSANGRVLAMSTQLIGRARAYGFKKAYDEAFASFAPGVILLNRLTGHFCEEGHEDVDSCAMPGQQPVSRLWPDRRELIDCRVALGGALRGGLFAAMLGCEAMAARLSRSDREAGSADTA